VVTPLILISVVKNGGKRNQQSKTQTQDKQNKTNNKQSTVIIVADVATNTGLEDCGGGAVAE
jgi:hypothetical protein